MLATCSLLFALGSCVTAQSDATTKDVRAETKDIRAELPRDMRIVLLGVPSVKEVRLAQDNLQRALDELDAELANDGLANRIERHKGRVLYRLGQLDATVSTLAQSLRNQQRVKGLEDYRDFARSLELHSETLASFTGTSDTPVVAEDDDAPSAQPVSVSAADLARELKVEVARIDRLITQIELRAKPDEERKAQLENDIGALGQFVFQIRNLTEDIRAAEAGQGTVRIDTDEIVRGVQGLVDAIRALKREKELRRSPESRPLRRVRSRP